MRSAALSATFLALALWVAPTAAAVHGAAPAGGGFGPLDVHVDLARGVVEANDVRVAIAMDHALLPDEADVLVEPIPTGRGRTIVHVRVPARGAGPAGPAWEALFVSGRREPIFSGTTGLSGDPGERTGRAVRIVTHVASSDVTVGDLREDLRLCGQSETLLSRRALDGNSLELAPATDRTLSDEEQASAQPLAATDKGSAFDAPLGKLLAARGTSVSGSYGLELTDDSPLTSWPGSGPGIGPGAFIVMTAPKGVPLTRIQMAVSLRDATAVGASKSFFLVTDDRSFHVTLPNSPSSKPGEVYEVTFPEPVATSCLGLVLASDHPRGPGRPERDFAEVVAYSLFDAPGAGLDDLAAKLSGPQGTMAAQVLERGASGALAAVTKAYDKLDARGRALAIDVAAASDRCEDAAALLARALCEREGEAQRKAREKLIRCPGASSVLARVLESDASSRACVAPMLAILSPRLALEPIANALAATLEADASTRQALRAALGHALHGAGEGKLAALLVDPRRSVAARLELLRGAGDLAVTAPAESAAVVAAVRASRPPMATRYRVLDPLAVLSRGGARSAGADLADAVSHDPDWPVRAHAAELAAGDPAAKDALVSAIHDVAPRVREAALASLAPSPPPDAVREAMRAIDVETWSFVKKQGVALLAHAPPSREVDRALGLRLGDVSTQVRAAALLALSQRHAMEWRRAIRERLEDRAEDVHLRAAAAGALGALCDVESTDRLTTLARGLRGGAEEQDSAIALGALVGLSALHPRDLRNRVAPLLEPGAPSVVRAAAERALAAPSACP